MIIIHFAILAQLLLIEKLFGIEQTRHELNSYNSYDIPNPQNEPVGCINNRKLPEYLEAYGNVSTLPPSWVCDPMGFATPTQFVIMNNRISNMMQKIEAQLGVVVIDKLIDEKEEKFTKNVFDNWKVGYSAKNGGVVLSLMVDDRYTYIQAGKNSKDVITDKVRNEIFDEISPYFRNGDYGQVRLV
ncbi:putative TPM domain [Monocercomonoides exilis]|uniref:putative TPM domain n=1 Tax=Monocercomonoides exilis TaxID=2049356 RepID=UPI0035597FCA|nr:putative TPM domain [Monocercomonoides exilis]|eukprot:MONOS_6477.1-p1 / transcript=MONOS_6477.1 / gene=MONOS_6477 / organism=Monocercomonoides_exilis_PA203 / gene_product=unspecified product / transcript_product=unspecified product / location=Mono_scaffold00204:62092-62834(+) / protein_length=185 / sequence_SO=supercontig / SO=protein_coding / is_pseudo=false